MTGSSKRISQPFSKADDTYDVIVVGSGYGGGIAGSRLARAGKKVAILERGREIRPGEYPDTAAAGMTEMQITTAQSGKTFGKADGLYDLRLNDDMNVFVGCGLGGTSLVNANVALEIDPRIFKQENWPKVFQDNNDLLKPFYDRAREMLGSTPYPDKFPKLPKLAALEKSANEMQQPFTRPPINVTFEDGPNAAGVYQNACNNCGDCCSGCNYGAKNTTLMNYLPDAKKHGAEIFTGATVLWVEKNTSGNGWSVCVGNTGEVGAGVNPRRLTADVVVLAGGTLGSTEILLRTREKTGLALSDTLGSKFSGNGDVLAFGYNANLAETSDATKRPPVYSVGAGHNKPDQPQYQPGPCIAGLVDMRDPSRPLKDGLVIEEGVMPGALAMGYSAIFFMADALNGDISQFSDTELRLKDAQQLGDTMLNNATGLAAAAYDGPMSRTQCYLVMSHDDSAGVVSLKHNRPVVTWEGAGREDTIVSDNDTLHKASNAIWAEFLPNPLWQNEFGNKLVTVHPIGGCPMGDNASLGVVNDECEVLDPGSKDGTGIHEGLFVCDGSVLPGSLGVNPLLTISAVSERAIENLASKRGWEINWSKNAAEPKPEKNAGLLATAFGGLSLSPAMELQMVISAFEKIVKDIDAGDLDQATSDIHTVYTLAISALGGSGDALPSWSTIQTFLTDTQLTKTVGPVLKEFLPMLKEIEKALQANDYGQVIAILEREMGDFSPGLAFSERMAGFVSSTGLEQDHPVSDPFELAADKGRALGRSNNIIGHYHIDASSLWTMMTDRFHRTTLTGTVTCPWLGGKFSMGKGSTFELLPENMRRVECWNMVYSGPLQPDPGNKTGQLKTKTGKLFFHGHKTLKRRPKSNWWRDVTTLAVNIHDGDDTSGAIVARGIMQLGLQDLVAQASTVTSVISGNIDDLKSSIEKTLGWAWMWNTIPDALEKKTLRVKIVRLAILMAAAKGHPGLEKAIEEYFLAKFGGSFVELIFRTYGGPFAYLKNFPASDNQARIENWKKNGQPKRKVAAPAPVPASPPTVSNPAKDGHFALTRYKGGSKGPLILAPGFGTSAASFAMETTEINFVEYLASQGYDVWLFDYRGSPALDATRKPFTIDDIAMVDWPAAVKQVLKETGADSVQALGHCVGSMTLLMAILGGMEGVRSVISSQTSLHPVTSWLNMAKADVGLASFLADGAPKSMDGLIDSLGIPPELAKSLKNGMPTVNMTSSTDPQSPDYYKDKAIDLVLWNVPFPNETPCYSPTCHRIYGVFGASFAHDQLNEMTHNALIDVFGEIASKPFEQLALIMRMGHATNCEGTGGYLEHVNRLANMPIDFLAGSRNQIFFPETTLLTLKWLQKHNPKDAKQLYSRRVFQQYAHMDFFIGKNASVDIYPYLLDCLNRHN